MSTLVVYFSRKGRTRRVAEALAKRERADIWELTTPEHTGGWLGFWWCGRFAMHRWPMAVDPVGADVASYDKVIVCSPVWVFGACAPVWAFLRTYAGQVRAADYVLVHFSLPMRYDRTAAAMDGALGVKHGRLLSVAAPWGRLWRYRLYDH